MLRFDYVSPSTIEEASALLAEYSSRARVLAGGTILIPKLREALDGPRVLIDINRIADLHQLSITNDCVNLGPLTTINQLLDSRSLWRENKALILAAEKFGNPLIRNKATVGGNLANASPAADMAVPLLVLDAKVRLVGDKKRHREMNLHDFFKGPKQTNMKSDELLAGILFPTNHLSIPTVYYRIGKRESASVPIISIAVSARLEYGICHSVRVALGAVAPIPIRAYKTEEVLEGERITDSLINNAITSLAEEITPIDDIRASARYRVLMAQELLRKALKEIDSKG